MTHSAYDQLGSKLEEQRFYTNRTGRELYIFKDLVWNDFIFKKILMTGGETEVAIQLRGLHYLFPIPERLRKRTLKQFGVDERVEGA